MILSSTGGIDLEILKYFNENLLIRLSQTERDSLNYWSERVKQGDTTYNAKYNKGKYLASAYLYNKAYMPKLAERLAFGGNPQITALVYKDLFKISFDCRKALKDFTKPVLIIQGRQDITGDGVAYEAHLILKNSSLVFINKSGHYSWWEQSEEYKSEVEKFIASID
jgi:proline iminopeptidase